MNANKQRRKDKLNYRKTRMNDRKRLWNDKNSTIPRSFLYSWETERGPFLTSIQSIWKKIGGKKRTKRRVKFDQASSSWTKDGWKRATKEGESIEEKKRFFNQMRFQPWFLLYVWRVLAKLKIVSRGIQWLFTKKKKKKKEINKGIRQSCFPSSFSRFVAFIVPSRWINCQ